MTQILITSSVLYLISVILIYYTIRSLSVMGLDTEDHMKFILACIFWPIALLLILSGVVN